MAKSRISKSNSDRVDKVRVVKEGEVVYHVKKKQETGSYFLRKKGKILKSEGRLSYKDIEPILTYLDYNQSDIAMLLDVDPSTISRWRRRGQSMDKYRSETLFELDRLIAVGIKIFGSGESFKEWLKTSNYALGYIKPIDIIKNKGPYGVRRIEDALEGMTYGNVL